MNKIQEKFHHIVSSLAHNTADKEPREWPPQCFLLAYQPMRPQVKRSEDQSSLPENQK